MEETISRIKPKFSTQNSNINEDSKQNISEENIDELEKQNVIDSIKNFNTEKVKDQKHKKESNNGLLCTNINDIDWLSNIFINKDIKNILVQNDHIKEILINQAIYYFLIFSKIFLTWSKERETDKLIKEAEKEREKNKQKYHVELPPIDMKTILNKISIPRIKVGIIGGGNIGKKLIRHMIKVKDKKVIDFIIQISTRQPDKLTGELLDILDDDITISLNNEKVFEECDIIFLCIQPSQLDLLSKEIFGVFNERIEKLMRREYKCFPMVISFLSATTLNRLEMFFPRKVHIQRTRLLPNFLRTKKKSLFLGGGKDNKEDLEYIDESCDHFLAKENCIDIIQNFIIGLTKQFYTESTIFQDKKKNDFKNRKAVEKKIKESPLFLFKVIFGNNANKYYEHFNYSKQRFVFEFEEKKKDENNEINEEDIIEENKIRQKFTKDICNDFKNNYISLLENVLKK